MKVKRSYYRDHNVRISNVYSLLQHRKWPVLGAGQPIKTANWRKIQAANKHKAEKSTSWLYGLPTNSLRYYTHSVKNKFKNIFFVAKKLRHNSVLTKRRACVINMRKICIISRFFLKNYRTFGFCWYVLWLKREQKRT